jgi:dihydroxyacetone kinase-like protein
MPITREDINNWLQAFSEVLAEQKSYLTELDSAIGDADHGANMDRGFQAVMAKLPSMDDNDIGTVFKNVGMTLLSTVGGAGGPLYATIFINAGNTVKGKMELSLEDWANALEASLAGIKNRGKAEVGDKTMVDAWTPAVDALKQAVADGLSIEEGTALAAKAAEQGMLSTIPLLAKKGRASYLGERSIGHQDPGATSSFMFMETVAKVFAKK